ncbi:hypothetical protein [Novipirellula aureliae]|uniref:hypothetical protein n=1 Tax=Novipirellula aureliae TaxID=2527966 RepID=UPI0011B6C64F|nr:hypothetical protein [Novipirellula aureliae]
MPHLLDSLDASEQEATPIEHHLDDRERCFAEMTAATVRDLGLLLRPLGSVPTMGRFVNIIDHFSTDVAWFPGWRPTYPCRWCKPPNPRRLGRRKAGGRYIDRGCVALRASGSVSSISVAHATGKDVSASGLWIVLASGLWGVSASGLWGDGATIHGSKGHATGSGCFGLGASSAEEQLA